MYIGIMRSKLVLWSKMLANTLQPLVLYDTIVHHVGKYLVNLYHVPHFPAELLQEIWNSRSTDYVETHSAPVFSIYIHKELLQWYAIFVGSSSYVMSVVCY